MSVMSQTFLGKAFTIRCADTDDETGSSSRAIRRIVLNAEVLKNAKLSAGDPIAFVHAEQTESEQQSFAVGLAWPSLDVAAETIYASASLLLAADVQDGESVRVHAIGSGRVPQTLPALKESRPAGGILLREDGVFDSFHAQEANFKDKDKRRNWLVLLLRETMIDLKFIYKNQTIQIHFNGHPRRFTVLNLTTGSNPLAESTLPTDFEALHLTSRPVIWTAGWDTHVVLDQKLESPPMRSAPQPSPDRVLLNSAVTSTASGYASVGGLDRQIEQIRDMIEIPLTRPDLFRHFGLKPPKGILLHGPPGTGKTHLARAIVASTRSSVVVVNGSELSSVYHGETESRLREVFEEARRKSPCIVVLDEVDALCPRREDGAGGEVEKRVVATLLTIMDGMGQSNTEDVVDERVVIIATTNRPNAIDPALRRPGRFDREIEIGIPDIPARLSILKVLLSKTPHNISDPDLVSIASRTHGYVGADLSAVIREAGTIAIKRYLNEPFPSRCPATEPKTDSSMLLTLSDIQLGISHVQPSAMREVFIETPQVKWSDIGGQLHVKQRLKECIEWPLLHPETFNRLGVRPPKGVLLYGPPGCSKTLTAKALATESGINFIAVKGPELLNKYVGESEKAVREVFRKARAASPSIIFFDEIDALGTSRSHSDTGSNANQGILTTLLNEMDGVQELVGVTVVAATNRPDVIDSALMRPGRLDRILYVGPPDLDARIEILHIRMKKMAVDPEIDVHQLAALTDGCSGAEIAALCQDAALLTMQENMEAPFVSQGAFLSAARKIRRQITPDMIAQYERWREISGMTSA